MYSQSLRHRTQLLLAFRHARMVWRALTFAARTRKIWFVAGQTIAGRPGGNDECGQSLIGCTSARPRLPVEGTAPPPHCRLTGGASVAHLNTENKPFVPVL